MFKQLLLLSLISIAILTGGLAFCESTAIEQSEETPDTASSSQHVQGYSRQATSDSHDSEPASASLEIEDTLTGSNAVGRTSAWAELVSYIPPTMSFIFMLITAVIALGANKIAKRAQQPYIDVYFEPEPGTALIRLVIKNVGLGVAENTRVSFNPQLKDSAGKVNAETSWIKNGVGTLSAGREFRTLFDSGPAFFKAEINQDFLVEIQFRDPINRKDRKYQARVSLSHLKNVFYVRKKG